MKKLLFLFSFIVLTTFVNATSFPPGSPFFTGNTYYVQFSIGADSNPGTILQPFKNWEKLGSVMHAGDVAYIRGGTYLTPYTASKTTHCALNNLLGTEANPIIIQNYPGESPVLDLWNIGIPTTSDPNVVQLVNCTWLTIKGLHIKNLAQNRSGSGISRGFELWNSSHIVIENMEVDHIGGSGFMIQNNTSDILVLNCDSHNNDDRWSTNSEPWGGADGFDVTGNVTANRIRFKNCRAWLNSDDGWDNYNTDGQRIYENCWSFWNGYYQDTGMSSRSPAGNGQGFKLGPFNTDKTGIDTLRIMYNCVAFENRANGFDQNGSPTTLYQIYNCTSAFNGEWGFQFQYYPVSPINHTFKNNVALGNTSGALKYSGSNTNNHHNSWSGSVTINNADFQSVSSIGVDGPRQSDGSLPALTFLHLANTSDLINAGVDVGLPYYETAPDMGAFESPGSATAPPTAYAGSDYVVKLPANSVTITGTATGTSTSYQWLKVSGPNTPTLSASTSLTTTISGLVGGIYKYQFVVTDGSSNVARDTMVITVDSTNTILPTGVTMQSVTINKLGKAVVPWTATVTANSLSFNIQRRFPRGTSYSTIGNISAVQGQTQYKASYSIPVGYVVRVCPVDKQGNPACSGPIAVKKN